MNKEINNIGEIFKETLKNHRMETETDLWARLDSQLAAQPSVISPKTSLLKNVSFIKVAAAASLIVGVALAYNFIYLPLVSPKQTIESQEKSIVDKKNDTDSLVTIPVENNQLVNNNIETQTELSSDKTKKIVQNDNNNSRNVLFLKTSQDIPNSTNENNNSNNNPGNLVQTYPQTNNTSENKSNKNKSDSIKNIQVVNPNNVSPIVEPIEQSKEQIVKAVADDVLDLQIPNIFTPNGDGINDYFVIKNLDKYTSNQLIISNRAGKVVFEKNNYQNNWDASNISEGVYYYVLKCRFKSNDFVKMGMVTIAR